MKEFPSDFLWGAATSSYQIEGAVNEGGRGPSIWDTFCRRPDVVYGGHTGDVACDHFHRYLDDVALFREIGFKAYRFSIAWSRVLPQGTKAPNLTGLDFYSRLVDALLEAGIVPLATLFHWDLPLAIHHRGGWQNRDCAAWFADYAALMVETLGDRVKHWMTLNEPQVIMEHGYVQGFFAPGERQDRAAVLRTTHHLLLAHGRAVQAIRAVGTGHELIGWAPVCVTRTPASERPTDISLAREVMFSSDMLTGGWTLLNNTWWMDPVLLGHYPADTMALLKDDAPEVQEGDMKVIGQPIDFIGANIYHAETVYRGPDGQPMMADHPPGFAQTRMDWMVTPDALYWGPRFLYERYKKPIIITENGISCHDWRALDGRVHDPQRIDFMARYLSHLRRAVSEGVPVEGYLYWSALDNFEWERGYRQRFGLIYVDFATQTRVLKDSAYWYRDLIQSGGRNLPEPTRLT